VSEHARATPAPCAREKLGVVIADDEPDARDRLRRLLEQSGRVTILGEARNGPEAIDVIVGVGPDVAFLDVRMPGLDGLEVAVALVHLPRPPKIVFVTAYDEYAVRAFEVRALDYVLKPYDPERLTAAIDRANQQLEFEHRPSAATIQSLVERTKDNAELTRSDPGMPYAQQLCIRSLGRTQFVRADDIEWLEAYGNYVRVHCAERRCLIHQPLRRLLEQLDPRAFCRVHRSAAINILSIEEMRPCDSGDYILRLRSGVRLKLSRLYRADLDAKLGRRG
jgi:two-component system LytT family response regulator